MRGMGVWLLHAYKPLFFALSKCHCPETPSWYLLKETRDAMTEQRKKKEESNRIDQLKLPRP